MQVKQVRTMIEKFIDRTPNEVYASGRMSTELLDNGNVALIGYGWMKLAEYNESENMVIIYGGHNEGDSDTVSRWLNQILTISEERDRNTLLSGESPIVDTPPEIVKYIGNYVDYKTEMSPVEKDAISDVNTGIEV